jgi:hypothetical protein
VIQARIRAEPSIAAGSKGQITRVIMQFDDVGPGVVGDVEECILSRRSRRRSGAALTRVTAGRAPPMNPNACRGPINRRMETSSSFVPACRDRAYTGPDAPARPFQIVIARRTTRDVCLYSSPVNQRAPCPSGPGPIHGHGDHTSPRHRR